MENNQKQSCRSCDILKDSFSLPFQCYFSTLFTAVDVLDPRHYSSQSIADYIIETQPDAVLLAINPTVFSTSNYFNYGIENTTSLKNTDIIYNASLKLDASENEYYHYRIPVVLEPNTIYRFRMIGTSLITDKSNALCATLYDAESKTHLESYIFDIEYCNKNDEYEWYFKTPKDMQNSANLLIYAGIPGFCAMNALEIQNVIVEKVISE